MRSRDEKALQFRGLHSRPGAFVIPNPWDAGTAKLLTFLGFEAIATTSLGLAISLGRRTVTPEQILTNCRTIVEATELPVTADLENCGADEPKAAAKMIAAAAEVGAVGASIEDATGDPDRPIYDFSMAVERVQAAVETGRTLGFPFTLTARADNLIFGRNDLGDTIRRLQAFETVGADVLYAPGLKDLSTIRTVLSSISKPLNVVMSHADANLTLKQLADAGVKRVSIGGAAARYAMAAFLQAGRQMKEEGRFTYIQEAASSKELKKAFDH